MSVGQGKALRAHQHKLIGKVQKSNLAVSELKDRQDRRDKEAQRRREAYEASVNRLYGPGNE